MSALSPKRKFNIAYTAAKKSAYRNVGRGKSGSPTRMRRATDLKIKRKSMGWS